MGELSAGYGFEMPCQIVHHPLIATKLSRLRDAGTSTPEFRRLLQEIGGLLAYEALRDYPVRPSEVRTPLSKAPASEMVRPMVLIPILRAGLGLAEGIQRIFPESAVGHIGLFRNEVTLQPEPYYFKIPGHSREAEVVLVDPMLATGNSATDAAHQLKAQGVRFLRLLCVVGCPQGVARFEQDHPEVPITLAALDEGLDSRGYILPGLGDAGDRYFGT